MKSIRRLSAAAICAACLIAGGAKAASIDIFKQQNDVFGGDARQAVSYTYRGADERSLAGRFALTDKGHQLGDFYSWCIDLETALNVKTARSGGQTGTSYSVSDGLLSGASRTMFERLFSSAYDSLDPGDAAQMAGFQLAVWEIRYDAGSGLGFDDGLFRVSAANSGATAFAKSLLAGLPGARGGAFDIVALESGVNGRGRQFSQHQLTALRVPTGNQPVVPLPAAVWLLLSGLAGLVALKGVRGGRSA
jgi:hypothetical protein